MVHGLCLAGMEHAMSHGFTPNHTSYMLSCYPGFLIELQTAPPQDEEVIQGGSYRSGYATTLYQECDVMHGPYLIGDEHANDHSFTSKHTHT